MTNAIPAAKPRPIQHISGIAGLVDRYDAFLLDLWGVIHDGTHLYPRVQDTLVSLREAGKKIVFISNAPRRSSKAAAVLTHLGVDPQWYDNIITSGEMGWRWLASGEGHWGKRYYYIGPSKDLDVLDGLDYQRADDIKACDFLLNVGFGSEEESTDDWQRLLRAASAMKLPMLCLNPDLEVVKISGERFACAGVLAMDYKRYGGKVTYFGKPYPEVYQQCMEWFAPIEKPRILAIGDGITTDIEGAVNFGLDCVLVTGGILKKQSDNLEAVCQQYNTVPNYVMPAFVY